jgi:two-component sensor histidine kinase
MNLFSQIELGGKYAISYRIMLVFLPFIIFTTGATPTAGEHRNEYWAWTGASAIATCFAFIGLFFTDKVLWRNRFEKPVASKWLFVLGFCLGLIKGWLTDYFAMHLMGIEGLTAQTGLIRAINAGALGALGSPLVAAISYSRNYLRNEFNSIGTITESSPLIREVNNLLDKARAKFTDCIKGKALTDREFIANELRKVADEILRPMSRNVAANVFSIFPNAIIWGLPWLLTFWFAAQFREYESTFGLTIGILLLVIDLGFVTATSLLLQQIFKRVRNVNYLIAIPILFSFETYLMQQFRLNYLPEGKIWNPYLSFFSIVFLFTLLNYFTTSLAIDQEKLTRTVARYLHGNLQNQLVMSAFRIQSLADTQKFNAEISQALSHFKLPEIQTLIGGKNFDQSLSELIDKWSALINLKLSIEVDVNELEIARRVQIILEESLSNALRHSEAESASIELIRSENGFKLTVINDGLPFDKAQMGAGLGSELFDQMSNRRWSLAPNDGGGAKFVAEIIS